MDELDEGIDTAKYAVFDDMQGGFDFFHGYKFWLGGMYDFTVTDKYKGKKRICWNRPCIWLCNQDPSISKVDWAWIEGNCSIVHLTVPIFRANTE